MNQFQLGTGKYEQRNIEQAAELAQVWFNDCMACILAAAGDTEYQQGDQCR
jgi:hypothetical protein